MRVTYIIALSIMGFILSTIAIIYLIGNVDGKYGYTGKDGYKLHCINNKWFYNHSITVCNELGVIKP